MFRLRLQMKLDDWLACHIKEECQWEVLLLLSRKGYAKLTTGRILLSIICSCFAGLPSCSGLHQSYCGAVWIFCHSTGLALVRPLMGGSAIPNQLHVSEISNRGIAPLIQWRWASWPSPAQPVKPTKFQPVLRWQNCKIYTASPWRGGFYPDW